MPNLINPFPVRYCHLSLPKWTEFGALYLDWPWHCRGQSRPELLRADPLPSGPGREPDPICGGDPASVWIPVNSCNTRLGFLLDGVPVEGGALVAGHCRECTSSHSVENQGQKVMWTVTFHTSQVFHRGPPVRQCASWGSVAGSLPVPSLWPDGGDVAGWLMPVVAFYCCLRDTGGPECMRVAEVEVTVL